MKKFYPDMIYPSDISQSGLLKLSALKRIEKEMEQRYPNARKDKRKKQRVVTKPPKENK